MGPMRIKPHREQWVWYNWRPHKLVVYRKPNGVSVDRLKAGCRFRVPQNLLGNHGPVEIWPIWPQKCPVSNPPLAEDEIGHTITTRLWCALLLHSLRVRRLAKHPYRRLFRSSVRLLRPWAFPERPFFFLRQ